MRKLALLAAAAVSLVLGAAASGHPDESQITTNTSTALSGASGMTLVGNADKDGTVNTDLAFNGNLAYAGNYGGFRILDIAGNQPQTVVDHACNGPESDVSFHKMGGKTFLFLSTDTAQTSEDCSSANAPIADGSRVGFEGVRVFDVTNPAAPQFLDMIQTACGSHTHTLVPDGERAYIYVSSFPLGAGITPPTGPGDFRPCTAPHKKISIIEVSAPGGTFEFSLREKALSDDTAFRRGFQACHDIQVFMPKKIAVAACAGDAQLWDISDPASPTMSNGEPHTHINSPSATDQFEFIAGGVVSWDGKKFAVRDETGGGETAECDGPATENGFYYFYNMVKPGDPAPLLRARYTIPRAQAAEACVSHNANVIPVKGRDIMVAAYFQGGNTVVDFTDLDNVRERAFSDLEDGPGLADSWSTYWYNGRVYVNGGLNRRGTTGNRGVDVFTVDLPGLRKAKLWAHSNPQTQEAFQAP